MTATATCPCGKGLHYINVENRNAVEKLVLALGSDIEVYAMGRRYAVPRHYIALHGLAAKDLPKLAEQYGWESMEVTE